MKASTDDGSFGFIVTPLSAPLFFRFQIVIAGRLVGDTEPCIIYTAMHQLKKLTVVDDERLNRLAEDPVAVSAVLLSDDTLHAAATMSIAESLDHWLVQAYGYKGKAVFIARECVDDQRETLSDDVLVSVLDVSEYDVIFNAVHQYWLSYQRF
jgi:hypothetical protein